MTITEFLLARIAEDEEAAQKASAATSDRWVSMGSLLMHLDTADFAEPMAQVETYRMDDAFRHVERHDPGRVLAECEAKRRIVDMHEIYDDSDQHDCPGEWVNYAGPGDPCPTLITLAAIYAEHPDYDPAWRP